MWTIVTLAVSAIVALPILTIAGGLLVPVPDIWSHLAATVLPRYLVNTGLLMVGVGVLVLIIGVGTAWLVATCDFPGRRIFEWALLLPFAMPSYVIAYAYTDFLQYAGPVQSALRETFGWGRDDYWFPDVRSLSGAIVLFGLVFYPYVYLLCRAAFVGQPGHLLEAGRSLGRSATSVFVSVAIPIARPSIVAGLSLALMETLGEFGAVQFFGVDTFTTGIYRVGFGMGEQVAAAQLAAILLIFVLVLIALERTGRQRAKFFSRSVGGRPRQPSRLGPLAGAGAFAACLVPIFFGFLCPAALLAYMHFTVGDARLGTEFAGYAWNSFTLAAITAVLAVSLGVVMAYGARQSRSPLTHAATNFASMGYAVPGSVVAVGVLIPLAALDTRLNAWLSDAFGLSVGLILIGTVFGLIFAYLVRFLAISFGTVSAALTKITPSVDEASRSLGHGRISTLFRIHIPMMRGSLLAAMILVFVDVMKELPATLMLRPFNYDTLAVRAHQLASDERLSQASSSALTIVLVSLLPVIMLSVAMHRDERSERRPSVAIRLSRRKE